MVAFFYYAEKHRYSHIHSVPVKIRICNATCNQNNVHFILHIHIFNKNYIKRELLNSKVVVAHETKI